MPFKQRQHRKYAELPTTVTSPSSHRDQLWFRSNAQPRATGLKRETKLYEARTAVWVLICTMKMPNNRKWPCLSFPSAAMTGFWHYIWLQYLFSHCVYACGSVHGYEPLNVGANGDQKRTSGSLELELLEVVSLPTQALGNCTSQRSRPQQIFLKIKSRERILERRQCRKHQERYPLPRCQVHCLIKCFAILSL